MTEGPREQWICGARKWPDIVKFSRGKFNYTILFIKYYIYSSKLSDSSFFLTEYINKVNFKYKIKKFTWFFSIAGKQIHSVIVQSVLIFLRIVFLFNLFFFFPSRFFVMLVLSKGSLCKLIMFIDVSNLLILYCPQLVLEYCSAV